MRHTPTILLAAVFGSAGLGAEPTYVLSNGVVSLSTPRPATVGEASPTPHDEIARVLSLLPKPLVGFVDFGCGADARWCIAAAQKWGCPATGIEIDAGRAAAAKERVRDAGLSHLVTIRHGDAITTEYYDADVGVAYLWPDVLEKLKPRLEKLTAFASYMHAPPGLEVTQNGDSWIYTRPQPRPVAVVQPAVAAWGGQIYTGPLCNSPRCAMCQSIRSQLSTVTFSTGETNEPPPSSSAAPTTAQTVPARNVVRTAVTKMVQVCTFDAFGRKTSCRMVPQVEYVDVPEAAAGTPLRVEPPVVDHQVSNLPPFVSNTLVGRPLFTATPVRTFFQNRPRLLNWFPGKLLFAPYR